MAPPRGIYTSTSTFVGTINESRIVSVDTMMSFEEFQMRILVIQGNDAGRLRSEYIKRFVNTTKDYFRSRIATRKEYEDGYYYEGYLWDTLKRPEILTENQIVNHIPAEEVVYVFWDIHSSKRINIEVYWGNYWRFPKDSVLRLRYGDLILGKDKYLPEDIYVFNNELNWSLIFTHEFDDHNNRYCYIAK